RRRHTRSDRDWSSDVCSSDLNYLGRDPRHFALLQRDRLAKIITEDSLEIEHDLVVQRRPWMLRQAPAINVHLLRSVEPFHAANRSEERRVGKECIAQWWSEHE